MLARCIVVLCIPFVLMCCWCENHNHLALRYVLHLFKKVFSHSSRPLRHHHRTISLIYAPGYFIKIYPFPFFNAPIIRIISLDTCAGLFVVSLYTRTSTTTWREVKKGLGSRRDVFSLNYTRQMIHKADTRAQIYRWIRNLTQTSPFNKIYFTSPPSPPFRFALHCAQFSKLHHSRRIINVDRISRY